jgi:hypothetical protein
VVDLVQNLQNRKTDRIPFGFRVFLACANRGPPPACLDSTCTRHGSRPLRKLTRMSALRAPLGACAAKTPRESSLERKRCSPAAPVSWVSILVGI